MDKDGLYTVNFFDDAEKADLTGHDYILDNDLMVMKSVEDESLRKLYDQLTIDYFGIDADDKNAKIISEHTNTANEKYDFYADIGKKIEKDGFEFLSLAKNVQFYKGTGYFYSDQIQKNFWVGSKFIAKKFVSYLSGGLLVYKTIEPINLLILNEKNLRKIKNEAPANIQYMIGMQYGVDMDIHTQIKRILQSKPGWKPMWVRNVVKSQIPNPEKLRMVRIGLDYEFHTWLYQKYGFDGTFLPYFISPFCSTFDEEININHLTGKVIMDKENPNYWENWGVTIPDRSKFILNEQYNNKNFRTVNWYYDLEKKIYNNEKLKIPKTDGIKLLSFNVRNFVSGNALNDTDKVFKMFLDFINKTVPNIIIIEEFESQYLNRIPSKYFKFSTLNGGGKTSLLILTDKPCNHTIINSKPYRALRNNILVEYKLPNNKIIKIIGLHLEIGIRYTNTLKMKVYEEFYDSFKKNVQMRSEQLKQVLSYNPDIITGDFNFNPDDPEIDVLIKAGYHFNNTGPTSIYGKKVDFVFTKKHIKGQDYVLDYYESDHKPILFDFEVLSTTGGDGGIRINMNILIIIITIFVVLLICYIVVEKIINSQITDKPAYVF